MEHSEALLLGFDAILREELPLCLQLPHPLADVTKQKTSHKGDELKPFAEEHLKTGYPTICEVLAEFREALSDFQKLKGKFDITVDAKYVFSHFKIYREDLEYSSGLLSHLPRFVKSSERYPVPSMIPPIPPPIKRIRKQRIENFAKLANHFFTIRLQVMNGAPLNGACELCPEVHIAQN